MGAKNSKQSLSSDEMAYLMKHTNLDGNTVQEWYSGFMKDFPNGRLSQEHFYDMYKMLIPNGNAEMFCKHAFRTFDTDHNGYIDFLEFLLAINITSAGSPEEKLKWAFKLYDVDGNGLITQYEMTKVVESIYDMLGTDVLGTSDSANERAAKVFQKLDKDGDCRLTEDEFVQGFIQDDELKCLLTPVMVRNRPFLNSD